MPNITSPEDIGNFLDLSNVLIAAKKNFSWDDSQGRMATEWYLRYLFLCYRYPQIYIAAISHSADDLWHQHIIDTDKYSTDCTVLFGHLLKHQPIYGAPSLAEDKIYQDTQQLYLKDFGQLPPDMQQTSGNYSYSKT